MKQRDVLCLLSTCKCAKDNEIECVGTCWDWSECRTSIGNTVMSVAGALGIAGAIAGGTSGSVIPNGWNIGCCWCSDCSSWICIIWLVVTGLFKEK